MDNGTYFFSNRSCAYFPCHEGIAPEDFNCMLCYCPLYMLGRDCGGHFEYTKNGIKSCMKCSRPHDPKKWDEMMAMFKQVVMQVQEKKDEA